MINDFHCDKRKCFVLEFGPNIDSKDIKECQPYNVGQLRILFSGRDWNRKGGDMAVDVVEILRNRGVEAQLIVAGPHKCPKSCERKPYIKYVGYLNKNNLEDYKSYARLYEQSHVFLLPTKAECSAIVYSEAAAAGLPCYTYMTGGVGNYVYDGINGYALQEGSSANDFADKIINNIQNDILPALRLGAIKLYNEKLSWEIWSKGFANIMQSVC